MSPTPPGHGVVLSLGSINVDVQVRAERWPEPGEAMPVHDFLLTSGGKAANVAVIARRLGAPAVLLGCVGRDGLADVALAGPRNDGVQTSSVGRVDAPTGLAMIVVRADGDKTILLATNANDAWRDGDTERAVQLIADAAAGSVLVADLEVPGAAVERALRGARRRGLVTVLDPSPADRVSDALLGLADHVTPNGSEVRAMTGIAVGNAEDAERAAAALRRRGAAGTFVKLPDGGCLVTQDGEQTVVGAPAGIAVVDKTGAGDAFAGAVAVALLEGHTVVDAAVFGVAASTAAVTRYGSQASYPRRGDFDALVNRVRPLVRGRPR